MSIIRVEHSKEKPYIVVSKATLDDPNLSWAAKGLWTYLIGKPDDWKIQVTQLAKIYEKKGGGEKAIYALLKELIQEGYCQRIQENGEHGKFQKITYVLYEFKNLLPLPLQRHAVERQAVKRHLTNKPVLPSNESNKQQQKKVACAPVVVPSSKKTKKPEIPDKPSPLEEKEALQAAKDYMQKLDKDGIAYNEKSITRQAIKQKWRPNKTSKAKEIAKQFVDGAEYQSSQNPNHLWRCENNPREIIFILNGSSASPYVICYGLEPAKFDKLFEMMVDKMGLRWAYDLHKRGVND